MSLPVNFTKSFKEEITPILHKIFPEIVEEEKTLLNSSNENTVILMLQSHEAFTRKKNWRLMSFIVMDTKIFNKTLDKLNLAISLKDNTSWTSRSVSLVQPKKINIIHHIKPRDYLDTENFDKIYHPLTLKIISKTQIKISLSR